MNPPAALDRPANPMLVATPREHMPASPGNVINRGGLGAATRSLGLSGMQGAFAIGMVSLLGIMILPLPSILLDIFLMGHSHLSYH